MKILVAPLNWGLGHATRCMPIIRHLLEKQCEVVIGADGMSLKLLQKEFPSLPFIEMPGYGIFYPENSSMIFKIALQIPKILFGIRREHRQLEMIIKEKKIDAVISDNRFGLWTKHIPCVFITHQLVIKSPFGEKFIHKIIQNIISNYSECWVPDVDDRGGLSGDLSHKFNLPNNTRFIGLLSRFAASSTLVIKEKESRKLLVILSGPEPQRTLFENKVLDQVCSLKVQALIVRGIVDNQVRRTVSENVEMVSFLTSDDLQKEILSSEIILSRSGYSTIMDLALLSKKAIFVPTPGQTEQEYLAAYYYEKKIAYSMPQKWFDLKTALNESESYLGFSGNYFSKEFKMSVDKFLKRLGCS